jgi:hypothetical protein
MMGEWRSYRQRVWARVHADLRDYRRSKGLGTSAGVGASCFAVSSIVGRLATGNWLSATNIWITLISTVGGTLLWYLCTVVYYRLRAPFELDEVRKEQLSDTSKELKRERSSITNTISTLQQKHAEELASISENHARFKEASEEEKQALGVEIARLRAVEFQPKFRFVPSHRTFGTETCEALEIWNDGTAIVLDRIRQASYIELSFPIDPSTPDAGERFAAMAEARYGKGFGTNNFGSILEERFNPSRKVHNYQKVNGLTITNADQ